MADDIQNELFDAIPEGELDAIREAIAAGADVNALSEDGETPLHIASAHNQVAAARLLLELGANPLAVSDMGSTPLQVVGLSVDDGDPDEDDTPMHRLLRQAETRWREQERAREKAERKQAAIADWKTKTRAVAEMAKDKKLPHEVVSQIAKAYTGEKPKRFAPKGGRKTTARKTKRRQTRRRR